MSRRRRWAWTPRRPDADRWTVEQGC